MVEVKLEELQKKREFVGKGMPLTITDNSTVPAGTETYVATFTVPKKEIWVFDKIYVTSLTGDTIVLSRILIQPNNRAYDLTNVALNNFKPANVGYGLNYIDLNPPIVLDQDIGNEKVEFRFSASTAQTLGIIFSGVKIFK